MNKLVDKPVMDVYTFLDDLNVDWTKFKTRDAILFRDWIAIARPFFFPFTLLFVIVLPVALLILTNFNTNTPNFEGYLLFYGLVGVALLLIAMFFHSSYRLSRAKLQNTLRSKVISKGKVNNLPGVTVNISKNNFLPILKILAQQERFMIVLKVDSVRPRVKELRYARIKAPKPAIAFLKVANLVEEIEGIEG